MFTTQVAVYYSKGVDTIKFITKYDFTYFEHVWNLAICQKQNT